MKKQIVYKIELCMDRPTLNEDALAEALSKFGQVELLGWKVRRVADAIDVLDE